MEFTKREKMWMKIVHDLGFSFLLLSALLTLLCEGFMANKKQGHK